MSERELFLVGLSHKSAPIEVRERVALAGDALKVALQDLQPGPTGWARPWWSRPATGSRCWCTPSGDAAARAFFTARAADAAGHLYAKQGREAVRHLFRVAASLDSMVVGEQQILGQVKEAYGVACAAGTAGTFLSRLCNRAFATAKRVRTETGDRARHRPASPRWRSSWSRRSSATWPAGPSCWWARGRWARCPPRRWPGWARSGSWSPTARPSGGSALAAQVSGVFRAWEELPQPPRRGRRGHRLHRAPIATW